MPPRSQFGGRFLDIGSQHQPASKEVHMISQMWPDQCSMRQQPPQGHVTSPHFISPLLTSPRFVSSRIASACLFIHVRPVQAGWSRPSHFMKSTPRTPNKLRFLRSRHLIAEAYSLAGNPGCYNRDACAGIGSSPSPSVASVYRSKATLVTGAVGPRPVRVDSRPCPAAQTGPRGLGSSAGWVPT